MSEHYSNQEKRQLLRLARDAVKDAANGLALEIPALDDLPGALQQDRACFVTLRTKEGDLRGCTGTLVARRPLGYEVMHIAGQTALHDPRFPAVAPEELPNLVVEVSILTPPKPLLVQAPEDILQRLRPHIDGVVLVLAGRRATFLPQVWERVPDPQEFLELLCHKMGMPPDAWLLPGGEVYTYQTIAFEEGQVAT